MKSEEAIALIEGNAELMHILKIIAELPFEDTWLCAGTLRNFFWNVFSQQQAPLLQTDIDVVFFEPAMDASQTLFYQEKLQQAYPNYCWELKNQVSMHTRSPETKPYQSTREAIMRFPETCTALGARWLKDSQTIELFAPYGLDDLCQFYLRPTPHFAKNTQRMKIFTERIQKKQWLEQWPELTIIAAQD